MDLTPEGKVIVYETDRFVVYREQKSVKAEGTVDGIYQVWNKEFNVLEMETTVLAQAYEVCAQWEHVIRQAKIAVMQMQTGLAVPGQGGAMPQPPRRG